MARTEPYQFYVGDVYTPLRAVHQIKAETNNSGLLDLTATQRATSNIIWRAMYGAQLYAPITFLDGGVLLANDVVMSPAYRRSPFLPADHWKREVQNIVNTTLAVLQYSAIDYASPALFRQTDMGSKLVSALEHMVTPTDEDEQAVRSDQGPKQGSYLLPCCCAGRPGRRGASGDGGQHGPCRCHGVGAIAQDQEVAVRQ